MEPKATAVILLKGKNFTEFGPIVGPFEKVEALETGVMHEVDRLRLEGKNVSHVQVWGQHPQHQISLVGKIDLQYGKYVQS